MNRIALSASILVLSIGTAFAQTAAPATGGAATAPRPAAAQPAPTGNVGKGSAASAADARTAYQQRVQAREAACKARGATFTWTAPHNVGDPNPKGGFYTTNSGGSCRQMTLKAAVEKGLVTVKQ